MISVTMTVGTSGTLTSSPGSLSFLQNVNGAAPAAQTLSITSGSSAVSFSAVATTSQGAWLSVSPTSGTTPATLTVSANGAGLGAGTYTGTITLTSPGVAQTTVTVTLTISSGGGGSVGSGSMAHLASAGLWKTIFTLVNNGTVTSQARLNFFDDNGNPLALPLTFPQASPFPQAPASFIDRTLSPGATLIIESTGPDNQVTQTGWAQLVTTGAINGFAVFRQTVPSGQHEAVVPLETRNAASFVLSFDNTSGFVTGVAMANTATQSAFVQVTIRDDNGVTIQSNSVAMAALGHTSFDLAARFPVTAARRGTVEFQTPAGGGISVLGIRFNPAGTFSTVPAMAK
jgi:Viral BACON domain